MTDDHGLNQYFSGTIYRVLSGMFGLFLFAVGLYAVFFGVIDPLLRTAIGLGIAVVGAETFWSSVRSRQSWLAKIGPFI